MWFSSAALIASFGVLKSETRRDAPPDQDRSCSWLPNIKTLPSWHGTECSSPTTCICPERARFRRRQCTIVDVQRQTGAHPSLPFCSEVYGCAGHGCAGHDCAALLSMRWRGNGNQQNPLLPGFSPSPSRAECVSTYQFCGGGRCRYVTHSSTVMLH